MAFKESWNATHTALSRHSLGFARNWNNTNEEFEFESKAMQTMCCLCVGDDANQNVSGRQRELLLWHYKLGILMKRVQQMMVEHEAIDRNNGSIIMPQAMKPQFQSTFSCPIPLYTNCELAGAKK